MKTRFDRILTYIQCANMILLSIFGVKVFIDLESKNTLIIVAMYLSITVTLAITLKYLHKIFKTNES